MLDVSSFNCGLYARIAAEPLAIPARPVYCVLITIVDPVLVVFEDENHAAGPVRREIVNS